ncbi:UNVERIFIED_CONTAM: hypothetical protein FKN15_029972 [Acipenser sinensis]
MLSRNLVIFSALAILMATVNTAPVEEKETEEVESEDANESEDEISEEDIDDDDDSKSQDMNKGTGAQQVTTSLKDTGK